jgi:hypothetical protein
VLKSLSNIQSFFLAAVFLERQAIEMRKVRALCLAGISSSPAENNEMAKHAQSALIDYLKIEGRVEEQDKEQQDALEKVLKDWSSHAYYVTPVRTV